MIKISKTADTKVKEFAKKEWLIADLEHYGKKVDYAKKDFTFKAEENGMIVGSIKGSFESGVLKISYLIVAHKKRGQGIGKALTQKAEKLGKKLGAHKVHLITGKDWEAEKFYQSLGYKQIAVLPKHHFQKDFIVYEKFI